jgi:hypothetical protein
MALDENGQEIPEENHNLKVLREKAEKADKLEVELAGLRREQAIERSGVDISTPLGKFFADQFNGDTADTAALVEAAKALGVPFKGAPAAPAAAPAAEGQTQGTETKVSEDLGTSDREALTGGAPSDEGFQENPYTTAVTAAEAARKRGGTFDDEATAFLGVLVQAANKGDTRVIAIDGRAPVNPLV